MPPHRIAQIGSTLAAILAAVACSPPSLPSRPSVVLISLDTLRPDRLGVYGNAPDVSPHIDAFAREAVVFDDAIAPAPWTLPSHMSLFTGLDPVAHGVRTEDDRLHESIPTLAERLGNAGYATAAFVDAPFVGRRYGFARGFDHFEERSQHEPRGLARALPEILAWLDARDDAPFFLFVHSFDAHAIYGDTDPATRSQFLARPAPPSPLDHWLATVRYFHLARRMAVNRYGRRARLLHAYDAGVHTADRGVGEVLGRLRERGLDDETLVILTSDHGESFVDRGPWVGHGLGLTDDEIAIPLLVKLPGGEAAGRRESALVDLLDVVPTVLDVTGLPAGEGLEGESLRALLRGSPRERAEFFGESSNTGAFYLVQGDLKYISPTRDDATTMTTTHIGPLTPPVLADEGRDEPYVLGSGTELRYDTEGDPLGVRWHWPAHARLFDRRADPAEGRDLRDADPETAAAMRSRLEARLAESLARTRDAVAPPPTSPEERAALEALGYVGPAGSSAGRTVPEDPPAALPRPDLSLLLDADRTVHEIRMHLIESGEPPPGAAEQLEEAADSYRKWAEEHPADHWRIEWRLRELGIVASRLGPAVPAP